MGLEFMLVSLLIDAGFFSTIPRCFVRGARVYVGPPPDRCGSRSAIIPRRFVRGTRVYVGVDSESCGTFFDDS